MRITTDGIKRHIQVFICICTEQDDCLRSIVIHVIRDLVWRSDITMPSESQIVAVVRILVSFFKSLESLETAGYEFVTACSTHAVLLL